MNPTLEIEGVLLTMFDTRLRLSNQVADEVRRYFGEKVFKTIIQRNVRLSEAPSFGKPVVLYDATCVGARNYIALAREIIKHTGSGEGRRSSEKATARSTVGSGESRDDGGSISHPSAAANGYAS